MTLQQLSRTLVCCLGFGAGTGWAQTNSVNLVSVSGYGNFHAAGIVATIGGDANGNASAALEWRPVGAQSFSAILCHASTAPGSWGASSG